MIIGVNYVMELSDAMNLDVSVAFKQSGTKETEDFTGGSSTMTYALNYLDISPNLAFSVSDQFALSFGPYLAFAMSGNIKWEMSAKGNGVDESESDSEAIKFGDGDDDDGIKAMDFGLNIGASYSINDAMSVSAGYALGLTNLIYIDDDMKDAYDAMDEDLPSIKNSGIFLTFGYTFGG
jgi:long-subunit fatty acid transport protein